LEIAEGLHYLHSQRVVHGDLRGANILVDDNGHACLADFGLTVFTDVTVISHGTQYHGGSLRWMAPELHQLTSETRRTRASDVYAFACVGLELYSGRPPFSDLRPDIAVVLGVLEGKRPNRPSGLPDWMWRLITSCWSQEATARPKITEIVDTLEVHLAWKTALDWDDDFRVDESGADDGSGYYTSRSSAGQTGNRNQQPKITEIVETLEDRLAGNTLSLHHPNDDPRYYRYGQIFKLDGQIGNPAAVQEAAMLRSLRG